MPLGRCWWRLEASCSRRLPWITWITFPWGKTMDLLLVKTNHPWLGMVDIAPYSTYENADDWGWFMICCFNMMLVYYSVELQRGWSCWTTLRSFWAKQFWHISSTVHPFEVVFKNCACPKMIQNGKFDSQSEYQPVHSWGWFSEKIPHFAGQNPAMTWTNMTRRCCKQLSESVSQGTVGECNFMAPMRIQKGRPCVEFMDLTNLYLHAHPSWGQVLKWFVIINNRTSNKM